MGITVAQATKATFILAVKQSISDALDVPISDVVSVTVVVTNRRELLSGVSIFYTLSVTSGRKSDSIINDLKMYTSSTDFATSLSVKSGIIISGVGVPVITDLSPTSIPSMAPVTMTAGEF